MSIVILSISILTQFAAAGFAFKLLLETNRRLAWGLIAVALMLMGVRRSITFYRVVVGDKSMPADPSAELVALLISFLMLLGVILVGRILRETARSERRAVENENLLDSIFENLPVGLLIKDRSHIVERANRIYQEWYGSDAESMMGRRSEELESFQSAADADVMNAQEIEVIETGETRQRRTERCFNDGETHTISITKFPIFDLEGNITKVGSASVDLTDTLRAQEEAMHAKEEAEQANMAKSQFIAMMSHEFRTPLNAIIGFSEVMLSPDINSISVERTREYIRDIHASGMLILDLVNDVLDISAIEAGKREIDKTPVRLDSLIEESITSVTPMAEANDVELRVDVLKDLPPVPADARAVKQILLNLLSNAVRFSSSGGEVRTSARINGEWAVLEIEDTGMGIPAQKIATVTEPFSQVDDNPHTQRQGTGLGLAIVDSLVQLHDGKLTISSVEGEGTTVRVALPLLQ